MMSDRERMGRTAFIRYRGGAKDVALVDERIDDPLQVIIGDKRIPRGIEDALYDMKVGEKRRLEIPCELGYGEYNPKEIQWYPRILVENGYELKVGSVVVWTNPADQTQRPAYVVDATEDNVKIDMNHPFAGKDMEYWVELIELK